ncbi:MAG: hypothetical protein HC903_17755 [Methylacidiphilales bacterium]|nr:hypothetical protein [Candidatus Methylacidiphilales bacterium]
MPSVQQLYEQRKLLETLIDLLNRKILSFRTSRVTTIDLGMLASIDILIEQNIEEREQAKKDLAEIDKAIASQGDRSHLQASESSSQLAITDHLYNALLNLDYQKQSISFRQFIQQRQTAAFLIQGSRHYGQRWLLNRLAQKACNLITDKIVLFPLKRVARSNDISSLWRELAERVGLERKDLSLSGIDVADYVHNWLRTQNVILIFHDVEHMPSEYLPKLIEQFWQPLVQAATNSPNHSQLLMFLVDYTGRMCNQNIDVTETYNVSWNPQNPIKLPMLNKFTDTVLNGWLVNAVDALPLELINETDNTVQSILKNSEDGTPEYVFDEICSLCDRDWEEETKKWLKL